MKMSRIGAVKVEHLSQSMAPEYNDGDAIEDYLLDFFKQTPKPDQAAMARVLDENFTWPNYYHMSPRRANVVSWFNFKDTRRILEVGAGCGAVTEELVRHGAQVTGLELSERRATINAYRNRDAKNLTMVIGNLEDYEPAERFDLVVCIGVLEYAGTFINDDAPYDTFLRLLHRHLTDDGQLLLAIENRLGLKYWAGAKEDHTGGYFDSLNRYPGRLKVQTFGRQELGRMFDRSPFRLERMYYPYPDYKHPSIIYSDDYLPGPEVTFPLPQLPSPVPGQDRFHMFSEGLAMTSIEQNDLYAEMANSFIVHARSRS